MRRYPFMIGVLFGVLQTGYFLQLSFAFSSSALTLFGVTLAWLVGSLGGLLIVQRVTVRWWQMNALCLGSYLVCGTILLHFPLRNNLLPLYAASVTLSGLYAGWFFGTAAPYYHGRIDHLFFWENNGFVIGLAVTTLAFLFLGRTLLQILPFMVAVLTVPPYFAKENQTREFGERLDHAR